MGNDRRIVYRPPGGEGPDFTDPAAPPATYSFANDPPPGPPVAYEWELIPPDRQ